MKAELEARLLAHAKKPVGVVVRTAAEMASVLEAHPFAKMEPKYTHVVFLDARPPRDALHGAVGVDGESMALGKREIFIHYPNGAGRSRLRIRRRSPPRRATSTLWRSWPSLRRNSESSGRIA